MLSRQSFFAMRCRSPLLAASTFALDAAGPNWSPDACCARRSMRKRGDTRPRKGSGPMRNANLRAIGRIRPRASILHRNQFGADPSARPGDHPLLRRVLVVTPAARSPSFRETLQSAAMSDPGLGNEILLKSRQGLKLADHSAVLAAESTKFDSSLWGILMLECLRKSFVFQPTRSYGRAD